MFTGIIENQGTVKEISKKQNAYRLSVAFKKIPDNVKPGDSISVNGICLTAERIKKDIFLFDITEETFKSTAFRYLKKNEFVNIERALKELSRIDGHFVSGHVDGRRRIKSVKRTPPAFIEIAILPGDEKYAAKKASIAIDGISLTIGDVYRESLKAYLVPHTLENTNLKTKRPGEWVNVEFDILAKYLEKLTSAQKNRVSGLTPTFLKNTGFICL